MTPDTLSRPANHLPSQATLYGWRLTLARAAWAMCAVFIFVLCLAFFPVSWAGVRSDWLVQSSAAVVSRYLYFGAFANYVLTLRYLVAAVSFGVAALIVWRKSNNGMALLVALGLLLLPADLIAVGEASQIYLVYGRPWAAILQACRDWLILIAFHFMVMLFFLFPDGCFEPPRMNWVAWGGLLTSLGLLFGLQAEWVGWESWLTVFVLWMIGAIGSQVYRYLRVSNPVERQQTKWFVAAAAFGMVWLLFALGIGWPGLSEAESSFIQLHLQLAWMLFMPLGVGLGVLRRGLWGADPIINRTLVYGGLTFCVILLYVLVVGGLSALFQSSSSLLLAALVTGAIAFLFQPMHQRLQRLVNRLMYGDRDDPATALARLGQRLETAVAPEAVLPTIVQTVAQTLRVSYAEIEMTTDDGSARPMTVTHPSSVSRPSSLVSFPLTFQSETLGHLRVAPRAPDEAFSAADRRLLEQIGQQAAPAVHAYRLTAALQRSREHIVTAREEERRRLRRDLHDGLGPALASQTLKLDAALDWLDRDPAAARTLLGEVKAQTQATVADIRRLVYELRPPALDELGLVGALRAHGQSLSPLNGLRVTVDAPQDLPPLSAAVEVAAYRIALEALTNAARHAHAQHCSICLSFEGDVQVEVRDDGAGLPRDLRAGVGIASMRERADELGGVCLIESVPTGGTRVYARLPVTPTSHPSAA